MIFLFGVSRHKENRRTNLNGLLLSSTIFVTIFSFMLAMTFSSYAGTDSIKNLGDTYQNMTLLDRQSQNGMTYDSFKTSDGKQFINQYDNKGNSMTYETGVKGQPTLAGQSVNGKLNQQLTPQQKTDFQKAAGSYGPQNGTIPFGNNSFFKPQSSDLYSKNKNGTWQWEGKRVNNTTMKDGLGNSFQLSNGKMTQANPDGTRPYAEANGRSLFTNGESNDVYFKDAQGKWLLFGKKDKNGNVVDSQNKSWALVGGTLKQIDSTGQISYGQLGKNDTIINPDTNNVYIKNKNGSLTWIGKDNGKGTLTDASNKKYTNALGKLVPITKNGTVSSGNLKGTTKNLLNAASQGTTPQGTGQKQLEFFKISKSFENVGLFSSWKKDKK